VTSFRASTRIGFDVCSIILLVDMLLSVVGLTVVFFVCLCAAFGLCTDKWAKN
jgi:hypothetical protein